MSLIADALVVGTGEIQWTPVSSTPSLVFVGKEGGMPAAIITLLPDGDYQLATTMGIVVGTYQSLEEAQEAFEEVRAEY